MLVIHPSSRCDICLDNYQWITPNNAPHAISCGHIFCRTCLANLSPSSCPLCRKLFQPDRVKRLHVDRYAPGDSNDSGSDAVQSESAQFMEQIALVSGPNTPAADAMQVVEGVNQWLEVQPDANRHRPLRSAVDALRRYKQLQEESMKDKEQIKVLKQQYRQKRQTAEQDLSTARAVEESLLARLEQLDKECQLKLDVAEAQIRALRTRADNQRMFGAAVHRVVSDTDLVRIAHPPSKPDIMEPFSDSSEDEGPQPFPFQTPLTKPPALAAPIPISVSRHPSNPSNPLPPPPEPLSFDQFPDFARVRPSTSIPKSSVFAGKPGSGTADGLGASGSAKDPPRASTTALIKPGDTSKKDAAPRAPALANGSTNGSASGNADVSAHPLRKDMALIDQWYALTGLPRPGQAAVENALPSGSREHPTPNGNTNRNGHDSGARRAEGPTPPSAAKAEDRTTADHRAGAGHAGALVRRQSGSQAPAGSSGGVSGRAPNGVHAQPASSASGSSARVPNGVHAHGHTHASTNNMGPPRTNGNVNGGESREAPRAAASLMEQPAPRPFEQASAGWLSIVAVRKQQPTIVPGAAAEDRIVPPQPRVSESDRATGRPPIAGQSGHGRAEHAYHEHGAPSVHAPRDQQRRSQPESQQDQRSQALSQGSSRPAPVEHRGHTAPVAIPVPSGLGSLGLFTVPPNASGDDERRGRHRVGSFSDSEPDRRRAHAQGGQGRDTSAPPGQSGNTSTNTSNMSSLSMGDLSLVGLPPLGSASRNENAVHRDVRTVLGLDTARDRRAEAERPRPESASSWGTVDSPDRSDEPSLSDLGLELAAVWNGRSAAGTRAAPAAGPTRRGAEEEDENLMTPRNRTRSEVDAAEASRVWSRTRSEGDAEVAGPGLGLVFAAPPAHRSSSESATEQPRTRRRSVSQQVVLQSQPGLAPPRAPASGPTQDAGPIRPDPPRTSSHPMGSGALMLQSSVQRPPQNSRPPQMQTVAENTRLISQGLVPVAGPVVLAAPPLPSSVSAPPTVAQAMPPPLPGNVIPPPLSSMQSNIPGQPGQRMQRPQHLQYQRPSEPTVRPDRPEARKEAIAQPVRNEQNQPGPSQAQREQPHRRHTVDLFVPHVPPTHVHSVLTYAPAGFVPAPPAPARPAMVPAAGPWNAEFASNAANAANPGRSVRFVPMPSSTTRP